RLGDAAQALLRDDLVVPPARERMRAVGPEDPLYALRRYYLPEPQIALGRALRGVASAAIDISDGLIADLGHLCKASGVGADVDLDLVPCAPDCAPERAATCGDDYELCFTVSPARRPQLGGLPARVTVIGAIHEGAGVTIRRGDQVVRVDAGGYLHF